MNLLYDWLNEQKKKKCLFKNIFCFRFFSLTPFIRFIRLQVHSAPVPKRVILSGVRRIQMYFMKSNENALLAVFCSFQQFKWFSTRIWIPTTHIEFWNLFHNVAYIYNIVINPPTPPLPPPPDVNVSSKTFFALFSFNEHNCRGIWSRQHSTDSDEKKKMVRKVVGRRWTCQREWNRFQLDARNVSKSDRTFYYYYFFRSSGRLVKHRKICCVIEYLVHVLYLSFSSLGCRVYTKSDKSEN